MKGETLAELRRCLPWHDSEVSVLGCDWLQLHLYQKCYVNQANQPNNSIGLGILRVNQSHPMSHMDSAKRIWRQHCDGANQP
jgi:hypothetical protein